MTRLTATLLCGAFLTLFTTLGCDSNPAAPSAPSAPSADSSSPAPETKPSLPPGAKARGKTVAAPKQIGPKD